MCAILYHSSCGKIAFSPRFMRFLSLEVPKRARKSLVCRSSPSQRHQPSRFGEIATIPGTAASVTRPQCNNVARGDILSCAICETRKEKRFCPAVHGRICPQCCGEQREVVLDCPSDCVYLLQAREHEQPRPLQELDQDALFLQVEIGDQFVYQHEHLIMGLSFALAKSARTDRTLCDRDLIAALGSLTKTQETLANSGLH